MLVPLWVSQVRLKQNINQLALEWKGCARPEAHVRKDLFRLSLNVDACTPLIVYVESRASETPRETHRDRERDTHRERERVLEEAETSQLSLLLRFVPWFSNIFYLNVPALCAFSQNDWTQLVVFAAMFHCFPPPGDALTRSMSASARCQASVNGQNVHRIKGFSSAANVYLFIGVLSPRLWCFHVRCLIAPQRNTKAGVARKMSHSRCQKCFQMHVQFWHLLLYTCAPMCCDISCVPESEHIINYNSVTWNHSVCTHNGAHSVTGPVRKHSITSRNTDADPSRTIFISARGLMRCPVHCAAARSINAMRVPKIVFQCAHIRGASWEGGEVGKEGWG